MKALDKVNLNERDRAAVQAASRLLKEHFPVEKVVLFGSKARGDDDPESDIDLLVLTTRPIDWRERESMINALFDVEMAHDVVISILDTTAREWNEGIYTVLPIRDEVSKDGVVAT